LKNPRDAKERAVLEVFIARELYGLSLDDWRHLTGPSPSAAARPRPNWTKSSASRRRFGSAAGLALADEFKPF